MTDKPASTEPTETTRVRSERISERVLARECAGCGEPITYAGRGRHGSYCSNACRQRAWALRAAEHTLNTDADPRPRVVREVVERATVRTVARVTVRPVPIVTKPTAPTPPPTPVNAREWVRLLGELATQLADEHSPVATEHWQHRRLYNELVRTVTALGHAHPGGLDRLTGH